MFTTRDDSRGLGLSAVQGMLEVQEAAARVEIQPGKGACFKIFSVTASSRHLR